MLEHFQHMFVTFLQYITSSSGASAAMDNYWARCATVRSIYLATELQQSLSWCCACYEITNTQFIQSIHIQWENKSSSYSVWFPHHFVARQGNGIAWQCVTHCCADFSSRTIEPNIHRCKCARWPSSLHRYDRPRSLPRANSVPMSFRCSLADGPTQQ